MASYITKRFDVVNPWTVARVSGMGKIEHPRMANWWTPKRIADKVEAVRLHTVENCGLGVIGRKLGYSRTQIRRFLHQAGIDTKRKSRLRLPNPTKTYYRPEKNIASAFKKEIKKRFK